ncbi:MAG: GNAT family N-acetyltransferase [Opitutaceae bacterium]
MADLPAPSVLPRRSFVRTVILEGYGVRLEPLRPEHEEGLRTAAADGQLWELRFTSVPNPETTGAYIALALADRARASRFPFVVREMAGGAIVGSTSYHDILPEVGRVEIGATWYAKTWQRTHVNTACKMLLMEHTFETLRCNVVGWRTDIINLRSQAALERLGAKKDGVIRGVMRRKDGTIRDTVMYSMTARRMEEGRKGPAGRHALTPLRIVRRRRRKVGWRVSPRSRLTAARGRPDAGRGLDGLQLQRGPLSCCLLVRLEVLPEADAVQAAIDAPGGRAGPIFEPADGKFCLIHA